MNRLLRKAQGREARNEQRKLSANLINALAILLIATASAGPWVNPALTQEFGAVERVLMFVVGLALHLVSRRWVGDIEDKN